MHPAGQRNGRASVPVLCRHEDATALGCQATATSTGLAAARPREISHRRFRLWQSGPRSSQRASSGWGCLDQGTVMCRLLGGGVEANPRLIG
jgi:hypothetical protein